MEQEFVLHYYYCVVVIISSSGGNERKWYKFDDGDVTEAKMEEDEVINNSYK